MMFTRQFLMCLLLLEIIDDNHKQVLKTRRTAEGPFLKITGLLFLKSVKKFLMICNLHHLKSKSILLNIK